MLRRTRRKHATYRLVVESTSAQGGEQKKPEPAKSTKSDKPARSATAKSARSAKPASTNTKPSASGSVSAKRGSPSSGGPSRRAAADKAKTTAEKTAARVNKLIRAQRQKTARKTTQPATGQLKASNQVAAKRTTTKHDVRSGQSSSGIKKPTNTSVNGAPVLNKAVGNNRKSASNPIKRKPAKSNTAASTKPAAEPKSVRKQSTSNTELPAEIFPDELAGGPSLNAVAKEAFDRIMPLLVDTHDKCEIDMAAVDDWCRAWSTFFAADSEIVNKGETVVEKQVVYECDGMVVEETAQMSNPAIGLKKMALKQLEAIGHTLGLESTTRASIAKHMTKKFLTRGPAPGLLDPVKKSR